jgi:hypothetical protein
VRVLEQSVEQDVGNGDSREDISHPRRFDSSRRDARFSGHVSLVRSLRNSEPGRPEDLLDFPRACRGDDVVVAPEPHHLAAERLQRGVAEQDEPAVAGQLAQGPDGGLRPPLDRLDGHQHGGVGVGGELGDAIEDGADSGHLRPRRGVKDRRLHVALRVADDQHTFLHSSFPVIVPFCVLCFSFFIPAAVWWGNAK